MRCFCVGQKQKGVAAAMIEARLPLQQRPPRRGAVSHTRDLPAGSAGLTARGTRLRFIDREGTAGQLRALESGNGGCRHGAVRHLDEGKAFGAAGIAINNDPDLVHHAIRLEELAEVMISRAEGKVAYIDIHASYLL
jgi:hypothetical protein